MRWEEAFCSKEAVERRKKLAMDLWNKPTSFGIWLKKEKEKQMKKKNVADITLRNRRAIEKRLLKLEARVKKLEQEVKK